MHLGRVEAFNETNQNIFYLHFTFNISKHFYIYVISMAI